MANVINKIKNGADEYVIQDPNAATKTELSDLQTTVDSIDDKIPAQATSENQLADKAFVTDAIQTSSAHFRGNWETWNDVPTDPTEYPVDDDGNHTPTSNDYMVVQDASGFPTSPDPALEGTWRFKYSGVWETNGKNGWHPEYQVNETPLTAAQLAALNSGITNTAVAKLAGVEAGAEVNEINSISVNGTAVTPDDNKNVDLTIDGGIKTLTTADYDYPTNNPDSIALWKLESGIYNISANTNVRGYANETAWKLNKDYNVIIGETGNGITTVFAIRGYFPRLYLVDIFGNQTSTFLLNSTYSIIRTADVKNSLTDTSTFLPLSAAQGKALNENKADKTAFTGTDGTSAGTMGLVPAPATTDGDKFLKGDGTWGEAGKDALYLNFHGTNTSTVTRAEWVEAWDNNREIKIEFNYNVYAIVRPNYPQTWPSGAKYKFVTVTSLLQEDESPSYQQINYIKRYRLLIPAADDEVITVDSTNGVTVATLWDTIQLGKSASAYRAGAVSVGRSSYTYGANSVAIGNEAVSIRGATVAIGSLAGKKVGTSTNAYLDDGVAIGSHAGCKVDTSDSNRLKGTISLGAYSAVSYTGEMNIGTIDTSCGYNSSNYRLLSGVYDPQSAHDAATKGYVDNAVINGGTAQPTTSTVGSVGTQYNCVNNGTPEIYICTDTTGGTYTWTKIN